MPPNKGMKLTRSARPARMEARPLQLIPSVEAVEKCLLLSISNYLYCLIESAVLRVFVRRASATIH